MADQTTTERSTPQAGFDKTQWTEVIIAVEQRTPGAEQALNDLCRKYRPPLYAFIRAQGRSPEDAEDLVQEFLVHLLAKNRLRKVSPTKGKFRSFLLACLTNFLRNQWDKDHAVKRGGGQAHLPIKSSDTQTGDGVAPRDSNDPQREFEREWAETLIGEVIGKLKSRYHRSGKGKIFDTLHPLLAEARKHGQSIEEAAAELGLTKIAVRQLLHRLKADYRELLLAEVRLTVDSPAEAEDEIGYLLGLFEQS
jgi:RNA polymerase sigma factor (sigma-70 family)